MSPIGVPIASGPLPLGGTSAGSSSSSAVGPGLTSQCVREIRVNLLAGQLFTVIPPSSFKRCSISNGTGGDVRIYTATNLDLDEYRVLVDGYERTVTAVTSVHFRNNEPAFWLRANQDGLVILEWT